MAFRPVQAARLRHPIAMAAASSSILKGRRTLLNEGRHALGAVVEGKGEMKHPPLKGKTARQRSIKPLHHGRLDHLHHRCQKGRDPGCNRLRLVDQLIGRYNTRDQSLAMPSAIVRPYISLTPAPRRSACPPQ